MNIAEEIEGYIPYNAQEKQDKIEILHHFENEANIFSRENRTAHITASAWVVNKNRTKVLMIYHNIYDSWSWLGGHADGEKDLLSVALKEVMEESGLTEIKPINTDIYSLEILTVDGHEKNGKYIPSHLHLNITYLLESNENDKLTIKADENSGVAWYELGKAIEASTEPWFQERIYKIK